MKKFIVTVLLTVAFLVSLGQADIRHWLRQKSTSVIDAFKEAPEQPAAMMYKWVDREGALHFSNIRPSGIANVEAVPAEAYTVPTIALEEKEAQPVVDSSSRKTAKKKSQKRKTTKTKDTTEAEVVIFTGNQCEYCRQAVAFLRSHHIAFKEYNIENDTTAKAKMRAAGGVQHVPFAVINGKKLRGFSEGRYRNALHLPATGSLSYKKRIRSTGKT